MITQTPESRISLWILLPILLALLLSAVVGLQLFQDGSSYLVEMLIDHSAVRHGRWSVLLFQAPTIFLIQTFHRLEIDPLVTLPLVRLGFNINYALTPFISLLLAWLVVRKKREELFIWAALIVLFVNLVNFSWVSELLISVQLTSPLLLAMLQNPRSKVFWVLVIFLMPFLFFLHPLNTMIYLVLGAAAAYLAYREPVYRNAAIISAILFLGFAIARVIYSFFTLSLYESSFAASGDISEYFLISRLENILFLAAAVELAVLVLSSQWIVNARRRLVPIIPWLIGLQSFLMVLLAAKFLFRENPYLPYLIGFLGIPAFLRFWRYQTNGLVENMRRLYLSGTFLAAASSGLLIAQYASDDRQFTLKMGVDLFIALLILLMAAADSLRQVTFYERILRFRLVLALSAIFAFAMLAKSGMWYTSVHRLVQTLSTKKDACVEVSSTDFRWLQNSPYTMIDNWSLPSLALVVQDERPRKALLAQNDCQLFFQSGMIQLDPWSRFSTEFLVPPLD